MERENIIGAIRGAAAVQEAIDRIGASDEGGGDHDIAEIIVKNELALRDLVRFALDAAAAEL
jgi:hypothetical protein